MAKNKPNIIAIIGPTATGKTRIGAGIAKRLQSEVISVDSQVVYQELAIGVAIPTADEMMGIPHHMIGVVPPTENFSAGNYAAMAMPILNRLLEENKTPILVGGTGFYLRALLQPEHLPHVPVDPAFRDHVKKQLQAKGPEGLHQLLQEKDPARAGDIHPNDTVRVIRALEIIEQTGEKVPKTRFEPEFPTMAIGLTYANRDKHVEKIANRLHQMLDEGFLEEVATLYEKYGNCFALQNAHGYPELIEVIQGKRTLESAITQIEINIRQYSKRQMTWFRRFPGIEWYFVDEMSVDEVITDVVERFVCAS